RRGRLDHRPHRPERRRQDDALQRDQRPRRGRRWRDPSRRRSARSPAAARDRAAWRGAGLPDSPPARADDRARNRGALRTRPAGRATCARVHRAAPREGRRAPWSRARARAVGVGGARASRRRAGGDAVRRSEKAARAGAHADERPADHPARRAGRRRESDTDPVTGEGEPCAGVGGPHVPGDRARHGPRDRALRPGDRDGARPQARGRTLRDGAPRSARARSVSRGHRVTPLLEVHGLSAGYGDTDILRGLSIRLAAAELVGVSGPNGAGKSTLLKTLAGLVHPRAGRIALGGADITGAGTQRIVASGLCYVPQEANVFSTLSVWENLTIGAWTARDAL